MKRLSLALAVLALVALCTQTSKADSFSFTFTGLPIGTIDPFSGSGTFTATEKGNTDQWVISDISGSVSDFFGTSTITGLLGINKFDGNDNILLYPGQGPLGGEFFDSDGVSFSLKNGNDVNLSDSGLESASAGNPKGGHQDFELDIVDVSKDPSDPPPAVPEPSTLALFGTGILGAAGAIRRRLIA
jgi:PEP-CTERM motif